MNDIGPLLTSAKSELEHDRLLGIQRPDPAFIPLNQQSFCITCEADTTLVETVLQISCDAEFRAGDVMVDIDGKLYDLNFHGPRKTGVGPDGYVYHMTTFGRADGLKPGNHVVTFKCKREIDPHVMAVMSYVVKRRSSPTDSYIYRAEWFKFVR